MPQRAETSSQPCCDCPAANHRQQGAPASWQRPGTLGWSVTSDAATHCWLLLLLRLLLPSTSLLRLANDA
jgi:hypothetical protein